MDYVHCPAWLSAWLCSLSQLLRTCSSAQHGRLEKVLDFFATTKSISAINIFLLLNPKHSNYWEENQLYPSQNQESW